MAILKQKQAELAEIEAHIQLLKDNIDGKNREFKVISLLKTPHTIHISNCMSPTQVIQDNVDLTMGRLNRAGRLTSALADEEVRWGQIVKDLTAELWAIPGDVLIASAYVAYLGAFPIHYRKELTSVWASKCRNLNIPSSPQFKCVWRFFF